MSSGTQLGEVSQALAAFHALDAPMFNSTVATSRPATVSSTPIPLHPTSRHLDLHRISLEASPRDREESFDGSADIHESLPIFEEPKSSVERAPHSLALECYVVEVSPNTHSPTWPPQLYTFPWEVRPIGSGWVFWRSDLYPGYETACMGFI
jgi:hypothetical protein